MMLVPTQVTFTRLVPVSPLPRGWECWLWMAHACHFSGAALSCWAWPWREMPRKLCLHHPQDGLESAADWPKGPEAQSVCPQVEPLFTRCHSCSGSPCETRLGPGVSWNYLFAWLLLYLHPLLSFGLSWGHPLNNSRRQESLSGYALRNLS